MLKVAVLISGNGSNLQALIDAAKEPGYPAKIVCVISNKSGVKGLERAEKAGVPAIVINHKDYESREKFDAAVDTKLHEYGVQLVCLAGFMRLQSAWFVERWLDRLINIHPSLLPAFPGMAQDVHRNVIKSGVKFSGCTVHFVRAGMDDGPIIIQAAVPVHQDDTVETLAARIFVCEHRIYPLAVRLIAEGRVNVHDQRVFISEPNEQEQALLNPAG